MIIIELIIIIISIKRLEFKDRYLYFELREEARHILLQFEIVTFSMYSPFFHQSLGFDSSGSVALFSIGDSLCYIFLMKDKYKCSKTQIIFSKWYTGGIHKSYSQTGIYTVPPMHHFEKKLTS